MKKVKFIISAATAILILLVTGGAWAAYDFNDLTKIQQWKGGNAVNPPDGGWVGRIGDANIFDTFGADLSGDTLTIYTNWHPNKDNYLGVYTADLFIDNDLNGKFDYAIRLDETGEGNVYDIDENLSFFSTSNDIFKNTGHTYAGKYDNVSPIDIPVFANSSVSPVSLLSDPNRVNWINGGNYLNNHVTVNLSGLPLDDDWFFIWGTGTCGNDTISGNVQVPEPASMLLLGLGLLGIAGVRRKLGH